MLKTTGLALAISVCLCGNAAVKAAQTLDGWEVAMIVGMLVGSEEVCGQVYDRERIVAFLAANVDPDDEEFDKLLTQSIEWGEDIFRGLKGRTEESCAEWREIAGRFGIE